MLLLITALVMAYLLASLSSAILICKALGLTDPRTTGSNNPGATNVMRIAGKKVAASVLLLDTLKGLLPVLISRALSLDSLALGLIAIAVVLGHVFPIYYKFKGGKGVATAFGAILALNLWLASCMLAIWLVLAQVFNISSVAALVATLAAPVISYWLAPDFFYPILAISALVIARHHENIRRLIAGEESSIK